MVDIRLMGGRKEEGKRVGNLTRPMQRCCNNADHSRHIITVDSQSPERAHKG